VWFISLAEGSSEPFQGSWAYLGPRGIILGAIDQFLGAWESRKKRGGFLILSCFHYYIENFQELNLGKVLFLLQPPKIYCLNGHDNFGLLNDKSSITWSQTLAVLEQAILGLVKVYILWHQFVWKTKMKVILRKPYGRRNDETQKKCVSCGRDIHN
jgi:hypothetical protein